jgi:hypothetical protein
MGVSGQRYAPVSLIFVFALSLNYVGVHDPIKYNYAHFEPRHYMEMSNQQNTSSHTVLWERPPGTWWIGGGWIP